ncbi:ABC transporter ATP-binding protein [Paenibacillus macerans]|uniref:ABC transporter ATP-binding protein n=1 Tax=Paenibacillus macerans TaxID=44252 RepID=UPI000E03361E|nr:ABC transporter ATP-binding protein [Paenibacillus macerans]MCY7560425.1 ABC transporter ATP-binding protein/permease [Paenibacillus macerans]MEC0153428.1 ABC transporter ATP-binding protein [Paenibacillus macerans]SUD26043.1 ABC transporter permease [Paenibacillus macerans]
MKIAIGKIKQFNQVFIKTISLLWQTSNLMFLVIVGLNLSAGIILPVTLIIWKKFIDEVAYVLGNLNTTSIKFALLWLLLHFTVKIISSLLANVSSYVESIYASYLNRSIFEIIMDKINTLDLVDFDNSEMYNKILKANDQSVSRSMSILRTLMEIIKNSTSVIGIISILVIFDVPTLVLCLLSTIPVFFISFKILSKWFKVFNTRYEKLRLVNYLKTICIKNENIKEIKLFHVGEYLKNMILDVYSENINEDKKIRRKFSIQRMGVDTFENVITYVTMIYVVIIAIKQKLSIGSLTMYISAIENLKYTLTSTLNMISSAYEDSLYMESIFSLLEINKDENEEGKVFNGNFEKIEFKNVYFKYNNTDTYVIEDLNLTIEANKSYSIVGLNGAGKTTLMKLLTNLYEPTSGEILIDGVNMKCYKKSSIYQQISAVFQDFIKYPLSVEKNIGLGDIGNIENFRMIENSAKQIEADKFINKLPQKYKTNLQREWSDGVDLSIGQWQKLAISRALMKKAPILVLDEPTASLDAVAEQDLFKNFKFIVENRTCFLIAHRFSTIKLADKIFVLKDKRIIEEGSHDQLIYEDGEYARLYKIQSEMISTPVLV